LAKVIQPNAASVSQARPEFKSFAVFSGKTHGIDLSNPKRHQIIQDGARRAGLTADVDNIVDGQPSLDGNFLFGRIDFQVTVETEIAHDSNSQ